MIIYDVTFEIKTTIHSLYMFEVPYQCNMSRQSICRGYSILCILWFNVIEGTHS